MNCWPRRPDWIDPTAPPKMRNKPRHEGHPKVTPEYVKCIRAAAERGIAIKDLATMFPKLRTSAITCIVNRTAWRRL